MPDSKKRKRIKERKARQPEGTTNPFLIGLCTTADEIEEKNSIIDLVLQFDKHSKDEENPSKLEETTKALLRVLQEDGVDLTFNDRRLRDDLAVHLLSWAFRKLAVAFTKDSEAEEAVHDFLWHIVNSVLQYCGGERCVDLQLSLSSRVLTQSNLFKVVPKLSVQIVQAEAKRRPPDQIDDMFQAFCILLDRFYRPTLDVAIKHILIPVVDQLDELQEEAVSDLCKRMVSTIVGWIWQLHQSGKGNPKTTFQLTASQPVLLAFSKAFSYVRTLSPPCGKTDAVGLQGTGEDLVRDLLVDAVFNFKRHIEGFRSLLLGKGSEQRLDGLLENFSGANASLTVRKATTFKAYQEELLHSIAACLLAPDNDTANKCAMASILPVLFKGFVDQSTMWGAMGIDQGQKKLSSEILTAIQSRFLVFLLRLLRQNSLLSKYSDKERVHFMAAIRDLLLLALEFDVYHPSHQEQGKTFEFLKATALDVNRILEATSQAVVYADCIIAHEALLRLNYLFLHDELQSILESSMMGGDMIELYHARCAFVSSLFDTYRKLREPNIILTHLLRLLSSLLSQEKEKEAKLLDIALRNDQVSSSLARMVRESPIEKLLDLFYILDSWFSKESITSDKMDDVTLACAYDICSNLAGVVWQNARVDRGSAFEIYSASGKLLESGVQQLLRENSSQVETNRTFGIRLCNYLLDLRWRCTFWLPASTPYNVPDYALTLLHHALKTGANELTPCYDELQCLAFHRLRLLPSVIRESAEEDDLYAEQKLLLSFVTAGITSNNNSTCCQQLSRQLRFWIEDAEDSVIDSFCCWVVTSSCTSASIKKLGNRDHLGPSSEKMEVVLALLSDAGFHEFDRILNRLRSTVLKVTMNNVNSLLMKKIHAGDTREHSSSVSELSSIRGQELNAVLRHSVVAFSLCNGIKSLQTKASEAVDGLPEVVNLLQFCWACMDRSDTSKHASELDCTLRTFVSDACAVLPKRSGTWCFNFVTKLIGFACDSSSSRCKSASAAKLVAAMVTVIPEHFDLPYDTLKDLFTNQKYANVATMVPKAIIGRAFALRSKIKTRLNGEEHQTLIALMWPFFDEIVSSGTFPTEAREFLLDSNVLRFAGDLVQHSTQLSSPAVKASKISLVDKYLDILEEDKQQQGWYIIASFVKSADFDSHSARLFDISLKTQFLNPLLEGTLCELVRSVDPKLAVSRFLDARDKGPYVMPAVVELRLAFGVLKNIKVTETFDGLKEFSSSVFYRAMDSLNDKAHLPNWKEQTDCALKLSLELINDRTLLVLDEKDLALVLTRIRAILIPGLRETHNRSCCVFKDATLVVASMFRRYTKQLYACVPTLIPVLSSLLSYVMRSPLDDDLMSSHAQRLCRVFELLPAHKEVYKKHIVGVVVVFVRGLSDGLTTARKNILIPAVYCLLDTMSTYETQQLNALIETPTERTLFKGIYQAYQKHAYKGQ